MKRFARFICILLIAAMICTVLIGCQKNKEHEENKEETPLPTMQVEEETEIEIEDGAAVGGF